MSDGKIYYMDIIAHACSVRCVIIITEYTETFQFADSYLCDIRHQIVRDTFRILTDQSALVCSDRVEISQEDNVPLRISRMQVSQYLLQHPFCPSVRICTGSLRAFLCNRDKCRVAVYSCRRAEDDVLHTMVSHYVTECDCSTDIVFIIFKRFLHRLSYRFKSCKVDHGFNFFFFKDFIHCLSVTDICFIEFQILSRDLFYSVQSFL